VIIILAFFQRGFSLSVFAVLGYLVNESVVVFDRVRESFGIYSPVLVARLLVTRLGVSRVQFANTNKSLKAPTKKAQPFEGHYRRRQKATDFGDFS
jgi:hypothetical protein